MNDAKPLVRQCYFTGEGKIKIVSEHLNYIRSRIQTCELIFETLYRFLYSLPKNERKVRIKYFARSSQDYAIYINK